MIEYVLLVFILIILLWIVFSGNLKVKINTSKPPELQDEVCRGPWCWEDPNEKLEKCEKERTTLEKRLKCRKETCGMWTRCKTPNGKIPVCE